MNTQGTHSEGNITFRAGFTINERYIFGALVGGKIGPANGKNHRAIAVITDCGKQGEFVNAQILGSNAGTMKVLASETIAAGERIVSNEESKAVSFEMQAEGSYQICGIALTNASRGQYVEFTPTLGLELTKSTSK